MTLKSKGHTQKWQNISINQYPMELNMGSAPRRIQVQSGITSQGEIINLMALKNPFFLALKNQYNTEALRLFPRFLN